VIFLDEPTAGVTPVARERFWSLICQLSSQGKTIFVTTHYMDEAEMCGRIALMHTGEIIALDTPKNLKESTFPHGIFEVSLDNDDFTSLKSYQTELGLSGDKNIFSLRPYGLFYHLIIHDYARWNELLSSTMRSIPPTFKSEQIIKRLQKTLNRLVPTLEDVFIELIEARGKRSTHDQS
ncbi:MAG: hypothetical protein HQK53_12920, partial [Oligoflexia bacterium]|nr:hypothetical protein [Oligoflexia bacterium]